MEVFKLAVDANGGDVAAGDVFAYTVTLINAGDTAQADMPGINEFEDPIPGNSSFVPLTAQVISGGGTIAYDLLNNRITWNGGLEARSAVVLSFSIRLSPSLQEGNRVSNQGTLHWDADGDGVPDSDEPSDDPRTPTVDDDATVTEVGSTLSGIYAAKTVMDVNGGTLLPGETLRYDLVMSNISPSPLDAQLRDPLPQHTSFIAGTLQAVDLNGDPLGSASFNSSQGRIEWTGEIPAYGLARIVFEVRVGGDVPAGTVIGNQGTFYYDSDGNGSLDKSLRTDDPLTTEADDATSITVSGAAIQSWYLAEGSTGGGMETYLLIQNPGAEAAKVNVSFQTGSGEMKPAELQGVEIAGGTRRTFKVNTYVPDNYDVSTRVEAVSGEVICERAMYGGGRTWAHDSIGVSSP